MSEPITRRPKPGGRVRVGDLPKLFRVIDFDGGTYVLESQRGARCRAGVLAVHLAEPAELVEHRPPPRGA